MIEWGAFFLVAIVSLVSAVAVVTVASFGMRLYESALQAKAKDSASGGVALAMARVLFGVCGLVVLFGVYLIIPALH